MTGSIQSGILGDDFPLPKLNVAPVRRPVDYMLARAAAGPGGGGGGANGSYIGTLVSNILPSAVNYASDLVRPIVHPLDTAENLYNVGAGITQMAARSLAKAQIAQAITNAAMVGRSTDQLRKFLVQDIPEGESEKYPVALGQFFANRYGSWNDATNTLRDDPIGVLGDLSTVLAGGALAAERAPGLLGRIGQISAAAAKAVDPINIAVRSVRAASTPMVKAMPAIADILPERGLEPAALDVAPKTDEPIAPAANEFSKDNPANWRKLRNLWDSTGYDEILSDTNRSLIAKGRTPVVDDAWVKIFPEDAGLAGELITLHHVRKLPFSVPLPKTRHMDAHVPGGTRDNPGGLGSALPFYPPKPRE